MSCWHSGDEDEHLKGSGSSAMARNWLSRPFWVDISIGAAEPMLMPRPEKEVLWRHKGIHSQIKKYTVTYNTKTKISIFNWHPVLMSLNDRPVVSSISCFLTYYTEHICTPFTVWMAGALALILQRKVCVIYIALDSVSHSVTSPALHTCLDFVNTQLGLQKQVQMTVRQQKGHLQHSTKNK